MNQFNRDTHYDSSGVISSAWIKALRFVKAWGLPKLLTLVGVLLTFPALAQVNHVVLDLEEVLVQNIPYKNYKSFTQKSQLFQIKRGDRFKSYYIHLQGQEWLGELLKRDDLSVSFTSDQDLVTAKEMLEFIQKDVVAKILKKGKILALEDKVDGIHDLKKISKDIGRLLYITHAPSKVSADQKIRVLDLGLSFYKFESWAESQEAAKTAPDAEKFHFPKTEAEWKQESYKIPLLEYVLRTPIIPLDPTVLKQKMLAQVDHNIQVGSALLKGKKVETFWTYSAEKIIVGCEDVDNVQDMVVKSYPLIQCLPKFTYSIEWQASADNSKIISCSIKNAEGITSTALAVRDCLSDKVKVYWKGKDQLYCSYYTDDLLLIADAPQGDCRNNKHVIKNPATKLYVVIDHFEGMEDKTIDEIFASPPPTAAQPYRLYDPYQVDPKVKFTLKDCQVPEHSNHLIKEDASGNLLDKCKPDALYSWGPIEKIKDLKKEIGKNAPWKNLFRMFFSTRSPLATFGYGPYSIRVKIKKTAKWVKKTSQGCGAADQNSVLYYPWNPGLDFMICSPDVIESWSYGQKEHYDEIIKDYFWFKNPVNDRNSEVEAYGNYGASTAAMLFTQNWDGHSFSESTLIGQLRLFQDLIKESKGEIFYNPNINLSMQNSAIHFKAERPIYFNER